MQRRSVWLTIALAWLLATVVAFVYRDALKASPMGVVVLLVLAAPVALAIYAAVEALGEGVFYVLVLVAFKVVTLFQIRTEFTSEALAFPWHGFARGREGMLVASEGAIVFIGFMFYVVCGVVAYLWLS
jgi:hypothetical protein